MVVNARLTTVTFVVLLLTAGPVHADFLGVFVGAGYWNASFEGDAVAGVDLSSELMLDGDSASSIYVRFEHPIPVLPNIRVARTGIQDSGTGTLATNFTFNGATFSPSQVVNTSIDLTNTDLTLYYELVDIGFDLDVGLTARWLEGEIGIDPVREQVRTALPMLYVSTRIGLPFSGLYLGGDLNAVSYSGNSISDYSVMLGWQAENFILPEFGIEVGYRKFELDANASDVDVDFNVAVDGVFINLIGHF